MKNNKRIRVAIIVEVKKRELPFMSILYTVLTRKGYKVKLIPFRSMCTWHILFFRPDIVLINGLRTIDPYFIKQVYIPKVLFKAKIACYYSEQVGYYNQSIAEGYKNEIILANVDYHISWGPHFSKDLFKMGVPLEKLWYVGSIQYDIDKYLKKTPVTIKKELSEEFDLPYDKMWLLYADNIIKAYQKGGLYNVRRKDTFDMVERIAIVNHDCHIIFRHHPDSPASEIDEAKKRFASLDNVTVIHEGHIFDWTCCISALIIWVSTSSLQVMFMGKPVFGFMTSDGKDLEKYWYKDLFPTYKDANQLARSLHDVLIGKTNILNEKIEKNRIQYISDWYFKNDGYAFERLCWLIDIIRDAPYRSLPTDLRFGIRKILNILYLEFRALIGDYVKNRNQQRNITQKDIISEIQKYDTMRFDTTKTFDVTNSESGYYLS